MDINEAGVVSLLQAIRNLDITEKSAQEEIEEDDKLLELNYACACRGEQIDIILEVKPTLPITDRFGVPQLTLGRTERAPVRLMIVIDVSHSMSEPFGEEEGDLSKLERVKIFASLLVETIPEEHQLGFVTFGTEAKLISPLRKMNKEYKQEAIDAIKDIQIGGVTNLSAGLFLAQDQFTYEAIGIKIYGPASDDNVLVFTDGNPNEGIVDTHTLIDEFHSRTYELKHTHNYPDGYEIRLTVIGTEGFLPSVLFDLGQRFSSDAHYFVPSNNNLEINIFRPIFHRAATFAHRIKGQILALNGATLDYFSCLPDYDIPMDDSTCCNTDVEMHFFMHDICEASTRHINFSIHLPKKHRKKLKGLDIIQVMIEFQDRAFRTRSIQQTIAYNDIPKKAKHNVEDDEVVLTMHENRLEAVHALNRSCDRIRKLDRDGARDCLESAVYALQNSIEFMSGHLKVEQNLDKVTNYTQPIIDNLDHMMNLLDDLSLRYDDAWAQMKAMSSSLARESPTSAGVYREGAEMFEIRDVQAKLSVICAQLHEIYKSRGLNTTLIEGYAETIREMEEKWNKVDFRDTGEPIICFNLQINK